MEKFDIVEFAGNLTNYDIPEQAIQGILLRRGLQNVKAYEELEQRDVDLLTADTLYYMWLSPMQSSSNSWQSGDASERSGSQKLTRKDKELIEKAMLRLYGKWGDPMAEEIADLGASAQWIDIFSL